LGVDAIILSENLVLRYEYGVFPFRRIIRRKVAFPSVVEYGIDRFLAAVAAAQARHPAVLLVPGVEVAPHYYWTGSLVERSLTLHNTQKNLLVVGLSRPEDYAALPAPGNAGFARYGWETLGSLWPVLLLLYAGWLWQRRKVERIRVGVTTMLVSKRARIPAALLAGGSVAALVAAWPFDSPLFSLYEPPIRERPYQALIDMAVSRGGLVIWSMPEARDFTVYSFGLLGTVTVKTDPYPRALLETSGYTGFGGLYQDTRTMIEPGGLWDQLLVRCLTECRASPPVLVGEIALHKPGEAGMELDQVLNIVSVTERTRTGLLEAMRAGRLYAVSQAGRSFGLRLSTFQVETLNGAERAGIGEWLKHGTQPLAVRVAITATDGGTHPVQVTIIRSGQILSRTSGTTPFCQHLVDDTLAPHASAYYRLEVRGEGEILSNPIFVKGTELSSRGFESGSQTQQQGT
jgi:hypothetical protein